LPSQVPLLRDTQVAVYRFSNSLRATVSYPSGSDSSACLITLFSTVSKVDFVPARQNLTTVAVIFGLVGLTFFLNQSAISANWRYDDGWLLDFASRFSPIDYFFNPAITRGYSLDNLTPSNPLIFDINLWLFGLDPQGFYLQHLATLAGCVVASYFLLRHWVSPLLAFFGGILFLSGAPSQLVAQQLMVGHYVSGLLLTILAIHSFQLNLHKRRWLLSILSTLFYVLATSCKEVYFPLPFVLLFLPGETFKTRLILLAPMFAWAVGYMFWRLAVLGSFVGGYDAGNQIFSLQQALQSYAAIPEQLFATSYLPWLLSLIVIALISFLALQRRLNSLLILVAAMAVLLPLLPLTQYPGINAARYLLLPWWLFCTLLIIAVAKVERLQLGVKLLIIMIFITGAGTQAWRELQLKAPKLSQFDALYEFFLQAPADRVFYSKGNKNTYYLDTALNGARYAQARLSGEAKQKLAIFVDARNLNSIDIDEKSIWQYDPDCQCVVNISAQIEAGKKAEATPPQIVTVVISPPYPPLFEAAHGSLKISKLNEKSLQIHGSSDHPTDDLEHQIILITPYRPKQIKAKLRPAEPLAADNYLFQLTLDYQDRQQRNAAFNNTCLLIRSAFSPIRLIASEETTNCQAFLSVKSTNPGLASP
jgi:hypothetical protein